MTKTIARRLALTLALGVSFSAVPVFAHAQTVPTKTTNDGITGTDPVPKGCGCIVSPSTATTQPAPASGSAVTTLLVLLGLA